MDQTGEPVPVHRLLREQTGMLEAEGLQMEGQRISLTAGFLLKRQGVMDRPFIRGEVARHLFRDRLLYGNRAGALKCLLCLTIFHMFPDTKILNISL